MNKKPKKQPSKQDWINYIIDLQEWVEETFPDVTTSDEGSTPPNPPPKPPGQQ